MSRGILALVPARGGSKGLPGKALAPLAGLPLVAHSIAVALRCPDVTRVVVSTDSEPIAETARAYGGEVPLRPPELAQDDTPMWPVVRHALSELDPEGTAFRAVLLLQPTGPMRLPEDVAAAVRLLDGDPSADGVVGVSEAHPNPIWTAMVERDGVLCPLIEGAGSYARRQDVPRVLNINGLLYLWRTDLVRRREAAPDEWVRLVPLELPAQRAIDIDTADDLALAEAVIAAGLVRLPWLD